MIAAMSRYSCPPSTPLRFGKQPVNLQGSAYYNVETPDNGARWQLRLQLQLCFQSDQDDNIRTRADELRSG